MQHLRLNTSIGSDLAKAAACKPVSLQCFPYFGASSPVNNACQGSRCRRFSGWKEIASSRCADELLPQCWSASTLGCMRHGRACRRDVSVDMVAAGAVHEAATGGCAGALDRTSYGRDRLGRRAILSSSLFVPFCGQYISLDSHT